MLILRNVPAVITHPQLEVHVVTCAGSMGYQVETLGPDGFDIDMIAKHGRRTIGAKKREKTH